MDAQELEAYLQQEFGWKQVRLVGRIRRSRRRTQDRDWQNQETTTWIGSLPAQQTSPQATALALRHHWTIENGLFYVRDVSYGEDRSHARIIAFPLSEIRNLAISLIRHAGFPFMTDAWCDLSARPDFGFSLLL